MSPCSARAPSGAGRLPRLSTVTSWPSASERRTHAVLITPVPPM